MKFSEEQTHNVTLHHHTEGDLGVSVLDQQPELGSQWAAVVSVAGKLGCAAQTLHRWVVQGERDDGKRAGLSRSERDRLKDLERENRELKLANEILRTASAYFAQAELDRRRK